MTRKSGYRFSETAMLKQKRWGGWRFQGASSCSLTIGDTMAAPIKFGVGQSVLRKHLDALIRGKGRYTDDHSPQPALHALMLRSLHAHAKFTINVAKAGRMPGAAFIL